VPDILSQSFIHPTVCPRASLRDKPGPVNSSHVILSMAQGKEIYVALALCAGAALACTCNQYDECTQIPADGIYYLTDFACPPGTRAALGCGGGFACHLAACARASGAVRRRPWRVRDVRDVVRR
jgi:hypothetical protein